MSSSRIPSIAMALLLSLALPAGARAESQIWTAAELGIELGDDFDLEIEQHLRFDQDVSRLAAFMPQAELEYQPRKWIQLETGYRLAYERNKGGEMEVRHRFHLDAQPRLDAGPVRLGYRLRFQERIRGTDDLRHAVRNRLGATWRAARPWQPGAGVEIFHRLDGGDPVLRKVRLAAWLEYDFGKQEVEVFYRLEIPRHDPTDPILHIFGLEMSTKL